MSDKEEQLRVLNMLVEMQQNPENLTDESMYIIDEAFEKAEAGEELPQNTIDVIDDIYYMWEG